jgi:hypothetical protein
MWPVQLDILLYAGCSFPPRLFVILFNLSIVQSDISIYHLVIPHVLSLYSQSASLPCSQSLFSEFLIAMLKYMWLYAKASSGCLKACGLTGVISAEKWASCKLCRTLVSFIQ